MLECVLLYRWHSVVHYLIFSILMCRSAIFCEMNLCKKTERLMAEYNKDDVNRWKNLDLNRKEDATTVTRNVTNKYQSH